MPLMIVANLAFAATVAAVVRRWLTARRAVAPLADPPAVAIRARGLPEEAIDRAVDRAWRDTGLVVLTPADDDWSDPPAGVVRVARPVLGDRAVVIEVAVDRVEDVLAGVVASLIDEGWGVSRTRGRKVTLRRSGRRATLAVSPV